MIRKSGWLIFLVLVALIFAFVYLFAGFAIKHGMIYSLEKSAGAEVNIDDVALGLVPLSLEINNLQITDKNQPTQNTLSFHRARADLELWPALLGYYVMDELSLQGLSYGAQRSSPGRVFADESEGASGKEKVDLEAVLQLDLPTADSLMSRANLQTDSKGVALQQQANEQQKRLNELKDQLPDKAKLDKIQADIKALTESKISTPSDLVTKTEQLKNLQEELKSERDNLRDVQKQLASSRETLSSAVSELRAASADDWQQLKELGNLSDGGLAPISQILLGEVWGERIAQLESLYKMAKPYLPKNMGDKGESEDGEEVLPNRILPLPSQPYPNFWIKKANINWLIGGGQADLSAQDITAQHGIIDKLTRFSMDVSGLPKLSSFKLSGDFSILEKMKTNADWQLEGYSLESLDLGSGDNALSLAKGLLASTGSLNLVNNEITQQASLDLQQANFSAGENKLMQKLTSILNKQSEIPFSLNASGLIGDPDVTVRSNLDSIIGDAILGEAKEKVAKLQAELRSELDEKLASNLGAQTEWLAELNQQDGETKALEERINEMLNAKLASVQEDAKEKLQEGLKEKLKGSLFK